MRLYKYLRSINRVSSIFQPINALPKNAHIKKQEVTSLSQKLLLDLGIIHQANPGCYHFLPLGLRVLDKLTALVDTEMQKIGAQKVTLSTLTHADLWKATGRLQLVGKELFTLDDRHGKSYILSPTCEESICDLIAGVALSYKQYPLRLYQISSKYRDEIKPRFGLMRGRQFIMKDLYTFDTDADKACVTYDKVSDSYSNIFNKLNIKFTRVLGSTGNIGGLKSHEYHFTADIGEDQLLICNNCKYSANTEVCGISKCPECSNEDIAITKGIEVGHTFLLGDKYSKTLNAKYLNIEGKPSVLEMGCYGLGISRILAASVEVLSKENEIRWPLAIVPYKVVIIPPKDGSKEELNTKHLAEELYRLLDLDPTFSNDILIDDRTQLTIGKRLFDAYRTGYPFVIVIGSKAAGDPPLYEIHNVAKSTHKYFVKNDLCIYLKNKFV